MSPFISNSGLSPGSHEAKVQWAQVCLNGTEPSVASLPIGRFQSGGTCRIAAARARPVNWQILRNVLRAIVRLW